MTKNILDNWEEGINKLIDGYHSIAARHTLAVSQVPIDTKIALQLKEELEAYYLSVKIFISSILQAQRERDLQEIKEANCCCDCQDIYKKIDDILNQQKDE